MDCLGALGFGLCFGLLYWSRRQTPREASRLVGCFVSGLLYLFLGSALCIEGFKG